MSENIPYIIAEDGYYYVAYKEKVKVPELVVSSKGIANGLSEEYNDGWDFGPDTYSPTSTSAIPYTQTAGIQEAFNYWIGLAQLNTGLGGAYTSMPDIKILGGSYIINNKITVPTQNLIPSATGGIGFMHIVCSPDTLFLSYVDGDYTIEIPSTNTTNMGLVWDGGSYDDISTGLGFIKWDFGAGTFSGSAWAMCNNINFNEQNSSGHTLFLRGLKSIYVSGSMGSSVPGADYHLTASHIIIWEGTYGSYVNTDSQHLTLSASMISVNGATGITLNTDYQNIYSVELLNIIGTSTYTATILVPPNSSTYVVGLLTIRNSIFINFDIQNRITSLLLENILSPNNTTTLLANSSSSSGTIDYLTVINALANKNDQPMYDDSNLVIHYSDLSMLNNGDVEYGPNWTDLPSNTPSTPSVPASGTAQQNTNPYPVKVYINGGALTEIQITIGSASYTVYSNSTASAVYEGFTLPAGASITLTYSTAPTWEWVPE
jgi:hypothetical protein